MIEKKKKERKENFLKILYEKCEKLWIIKMFKY